MTLSLIRDTVQQAAQAITAALDLETEIVDESLKIIGGTGRYAEKIGSYEENGDLDSPFVYASCLRNGREYITFEPGSETFYAAKEKEMAEICCPIQIEQKAIGLIGLIAFTPQQRQLMIEKTSELTTFLRIMAELIAGKLVISQSNIHLQNTLSSLLSSSDESASFQNIISVSDVMEKVKQRALQVSQSDSTILITGESGTGKDLLARCIHEESPRSDKPFVSVNCAAIPEMLLESELFGYEKGAFTGAQKGGKLGKFQLADHGTLFLDEIGDMPLHLQVKLLTCLQNHQVDPVGGEAPIDVDVRIIAATNKNLEEMIEKKQFREDLYFRLNVIPIYLPPLRQRPEDIELLLTHAIRKFSQKLDKPVSAIEPEALSALLSYHWPGNVREVENVIEYAINMENSSSIGLSSLPDKILSRTSAAASARGGLLKDQLACAEREIIAECLSRTGHSLEGKRKAAEILGISESTLYRRLRALDLL